MRRMLSGLLATAMVASVCATASFAATNPKIEFTVDVTALTSLNYSKVQLVNTTEGVVIGEADIEIVGTAKPSDAAKVAGFLHGVEFTNVEIGGKIYQISLRKDAGAKITAVLSPAAITESKDNFDLRFVGVDPADEEKTVTESATNGVGATVVDTKDGETADIERVGTHLKAADVIVCDGEGNPIPLTEDPRGVDKDLNSDDGIQSGSTVYFMIKDGDYKFGNDDYWKLKVSKGDNGKYIKAISDVTKKFSGNLYNAVNGGVVQNTGAARHRYIKVELSEIYTDDEIKMSLDMRLTAKDAAVRNFPIEDDTEFKVSDFTFYMKNLVKAADGDWRVGVGGLMLNPVKNDWNEVTYYDEDGDLAYLKFFGDSDTGKFYAKLSTKWEHADYASYFNDQDAYIFQFTGSPSLSSTSRADLEIYSPFVDQDGNETFDPEQAIIYQVMDGDLFDITNQFEYREGNNGDMAYCSRVRFLGTFIICQKPVDEASNDDVVDLVPDDNLTPDNNAGAPVEVNPGSNGGSGSKAPANTGKF